MWFFFSLFFFFFFFFFFSLLTTPFSSGLEVVTVDAATPYSSAAVTFRAGSRFETFETRGAAAHLAKLLLAGNASGETNVTITRRLLQSTTHSYARSHRETLSYSVSFSRDEQAGVLAQLGSVVQPALRDWEVEDARPFLEEDADASRADPYSIQESAHWTAFRGTPLAHSPVPSNASADLESLRNYRNRFLNRNNAVIVGVGVEHEAFVAQAETAFGGLPKGNKATSDKSVYVGGETHIENEIQPLFVLAFEGAALSSKEYLVAGVLNEVLGRTPDRLYSKPRPGDGMHSRLNRKAWARRRRHFGRVVCVVLL